MERTGIGIWAKQTPASQVGVRLAKLAQTVKMVLMVSLVKTVQMVIHQRRM